MQLDNFTLQDIGNQTANDCDQMYFSQETLRIGHGLLGFKYKTMKKLCPLTIWYTHAYNQR